MKVITVTRLSQFGFPGMPTSNWRFVCRDWFWSNLEINTYGRVRSYLGLDRWRSWVEMHRGSLCRSHNCPGSSEAGWAFIHSCWPWEVLDFVGELLAQSEGSFLGSTDSCRDPACIAYKSREILCSVLKWGLSITSRWPQHISRCCNVRD